MLVEKAAIYCILSLFNELLIFQAQCSLFAVHLLYFSLHSAHEVQSFNRSPLLQRGASQSAHQPVSRLLVLMRKNLGLKGFLPFLTDAPQESPPLFFSSILAFGRL